MRVAWQPGQILSAVALSRSMRTGLRVTSDIWLSLVNVRFGMP
jgi:hypothetical protein